MFNIVILDDNYSDIINMKETFEQSKEISNFHYNIRTFTSANELENEILNYDIFFIDIDMPDINGIEFAKKIRKMKTAAIIIFMTNREDLMHVSLSVQPFYFIRKSNFDFDCNVLFPLLREKLNQSKKAIKLQVKGRIKQVMMEDIILAESYNHYVTIHLIKEKLDLKSKLSFIIKELNSESFVQIHKSYVINMIFIDYIKGNLVVLKNNMVFPIGRKYREEVLARYKRFLLL